MLNFTFNSVMRIVFARGAIKHLGEIAGEFGSRALIISNSDRSGRRGLMASVKELLSQKKIESAAISVAGEPTVADVDRGLQEARQFRCNVVIGFGGGSAIDAAKAIAGLLTHGGSALDYMEVVGRGQKITKPGVPFIAVPTTAGTGAEVTRNAVVGAPEKQYKASLRSEYLLARVALIDPELQINVRPEVTARTGMDALTQLIESYTSVNANPLSDALALKGIEHAGCGLARAFHDGSDLDAREDMALAALLSGITLTNAGLGAVHAFAAPMGARYTVPHGTVCAALLPPVVAGNIATLHGVEAGRPSLQRYEQVAAILGCGNVDSLPKHLKALKSELEIPGLGQYGLKKEDFIELIALARRTNNMKCNAAVLNDAQLNEILQSSL